MAASRRMGDARAMSPELLGISALLDGAVAERVAPAAQACAIRDGAVIHSSAHGALPDGTPPGEGCRFDVASVSKLVTTLAAAVLVERRALDLDAPVQRWLPGFTGKEAVTPRHLLAHTSGLPAWLPLFDGCVRDPVASELFPPAHLEGGRRAAAVERSRRILLDAALSCPLAGRMGDRVYSDIGFIALGRLVEEIGGASLAELAGRWLFGPLGLGRTGYVDLAAPDLERRLAGERIAPTGGTRPREPAPGQEGRYGVPAQEPAPAPGQVDDDNAYALGGIAGHAGLFSTAGDLAWLGQRILEELDGSGRLGVRGTLELFVRPSACLEGAPRGLGFDLPAAAGSAVGERFGKAGSRGAVGHLGFTGCSLWVDLDRRISAALLTNRVFYGRRNVEGIRRLRPAFHDLALEASG
jgi:CubicO group peptidase (beta-lactamase class C family)